MRSRIAITALLATGALMSSGGAAIGVTALSTTSDASQAQYGTATQTTPRSDVTPQNVTPQGDTLAGGDQGTNPPSGGVKNAGDESTPTPTAQAAQPARQLESNSADELPFTGYAAIPLLLVGLALLVTGLVLRRSTSTAGRRLT
ncbi:MAG: hypothetical protein AVDCRST_MAG67-2266 [uncultured Solirubrobacteraceae bacterium]|uniref:Gram-positive cocci surface proteins LPxTG domain-containing protein n=1 Tax=uncultured Solirubrobacteraceae bacterium TaxID=1162706 RepID=A0A6J4STM4_9ACTN|nr:MAG: hypothetical protein AVDCRST_MAG67-2266 [uncultured Solirubrobacteraceae bacterium]